MNVITGLLFRHLLTSVGGAVVAAGWLTATDWQTVVGAISSLVGIGLSVWNKQRKGMFVK